ncbi:MAG: fibronectin type III domain-containing protein [Nitrospirae bacterium]|nr:fibronectin type III domain-containing protein [Nitrospirota bacterium]
MKCEIKRPLAFFLFVSIILWSGLIYASNYNWIQSDWSGGADPSVSASHPGNQSGWNKFSSKDPYVNTSIAGQISISPQPGSITQTSDVLDFDRGILTNLEIKGGGGTYTTTRYEDNNPAVIKTGTWATSTLFSPSGGTFTNSNQQGATASFTFSGIQVTWIGPKHPAFGIADVYLDNTLVASVDTYRSVAIGQQTIFTASGLTNNAHTIRIVVSGRKNSASSNTYIGIDAFDVLTVSNPDTAAYITFVANGGTGFITQTADAADFDRGTLTNVVINGTGYYSNPPQRYEDNNSAVVKTGTWATSTLYNPSGGTFINSNQQGATASLTFTGVQVTWIGPKHPAFGIADVYLDNILVGSVDTYINTAIGQQTLFTASGLTNTTHTIRITVSGRKNNASINTYVGVDAFDVIAAFPDNNASLLLAGGVLSGTYESPSFDTDSGGALFYSITWNSVVPAGSSLKFRIATNNDNLTWNFVGPNGTTGANDYYTAPPPPIYSGHNRDRYVRYKAYFDRDSAAVSSPRLDDVTINYGLVSFLKGVYESPSFDIGAGGAFFSNLTWNSTVPAGSSLKFRIATNSDNLTWNFVGPNGTTGANDYYTTPSSPIYSGHVGDRYIKYRAYFERPDINPLYNPRLDDVTIHYEVNPPLQTLVSSPYDSTVLINVINRWKWSEDIPASTDLVLQLRTSANGTAWSPWYGPHNTTFSASTGVSQVTVADTTGFSAGGRVTLTNSADTDQMEVRKITAINPAGSMITLDSATTYSYAAGSSFTDTYTDPAGTEAINPAHRSGDSGVNDDRWLQYRVFLVTGLGTITPVLSESRIGYFPADGRYQPDGVIDGNGDGTFGDGTCGGGASPCYGAFGSGNGGTSSKNIDPGFEGGQNTYNIQIQNDGTVPSIDPSNDTDIYTVTYNIPSDASGSWTVSIPGLIDEDPVLSGTQVAVKAGNVLPYSLIVTPSDYAPANSSQDIILNLRSENNYARVDSIKATTMIKPVYQADGIIGIVNPDGSISNENGDGPPVDPGNIGHDTSGQGNGGSSSRSAIPGDSVKFSLKIENEGNIRDRYTLSHTTSCVDVNDMVKPLSPIWKIFINDGAKDYEITSSPVTLPQPQDQYIPATVNRNAISFKRYTLIVVPQGEPLTCNTILKIKSFGDDKLKDSLKATTILAPTYKVDGIIYAYGYGDVEVIGDSIGDDDGICETGEQCIAEIKYSNVMGQGCGTSGPGDNIYGTTGSGNGGCASRDILAGTSREITVGVQNEGNVPDTYRISWSSPGGWNVVMQERLNNGSMIEYGPPAVVVPTATAGNPSNYNMGGSPFFTFKITPPSSFTSGSQTITFDIQSIGDSSKFDSVRAVINSSDTTPPAPVVLDIDSLTTTSFKVSWTAPGDDGVSGTATSYDLRYSTSPITDNNFLQNPRVSSCKAGESNLGKPKSAGNSESCTISQLYANTDYYVALKTSDEAGNVSSISTCSGCPAHTQISGDATRPGTITDLVVTDVSKDSMTLCWTAPADDGTNLSSGAVTGYDLRYSTREIVVDSSTPGAGQVVFPSAKSVIPSGGFLPPKSPGMKECYIVPVENKIDTGGGVIDDRTLNTRFYFAVKAMDERGKDADTSIADAHKSLISTGEVMGLTPLVPYDYNMVSVPYHPVPDTPAAVFGDDVGAQLTVYQWDSRGPDFNSGCYNGEPSPYSTAPASYTCSKLTSIKEGIGYYLWVPPGNITLDVPLASTPAPAQSCLDDRGVTFQCNVLSLQDGWNMIGAPYDKEINFSPRDINNNGGIENSERGLYIRRTNQGAVTVATFQDAVISRSWIDASVFTNHTYEVCDQDRPGEPQGTRCSLVMQPWKAYWIKVHGEGALVTFEILAPK